MKPVCGTQGVPGFPLGRTLPPSASGGNCSDSCNLPSHSLVEKLFPSTNTLLAWFSVRDLVVGFYFSD